MKRIAKNACVQLGIAVLFPLASLAQSVITPTAAGNNGAAPIGIAATTTELLFTESFCAGGNAVTTLGHQLIAAIANYTAGGVQTPAATLAIGQAIALLCANAIDMTTNFVQSGTTLGQQMTALAGTLDAYNCSAPNCEGNFD
jgi:hypothetical protein